MERLNRFWTVGLLVLLAGGIFFGSTIPVTAQAKAPPPVLIKDQSKFTTFGKGSNGNEETPGEWYRGATPDNLISDAPVLLFVPGLNNVAQLFREDNNMYQTAYDAGYQTAFIQLHDAGGASADMWNNGNLLASKICEIFSYFDGKPITVVAYSKGGVDTQTALAHYGAWPYVDNVITLSSPHHGSELADLAYSAGAGWLAELIGARGEGTAAMQTAYMADFRNQMDANPNAYRNEYFTIGGTNWGSAFSANWFGGVYLSSYGPNDGVVTAVSSNLPGGHELAVGDWNHTSVRTEATFPVFRNYLSGDHYVAEKRTHQDELRSKISPEINRWMDGGPLNEQEEIIFHVEEGVKEIQAGLLTAETLDGIKVIDPSGNQVKVDVEQVEFEEGIFKDAVGYQFTVPRPTVGVWNIAVQSDEENNAYLALIDFKTEQLIKSAEKSGVIQQHGFSFQADNKVDMDSLVVTYRMAESANPDQQKEWTVKGRNALSEPLQLDKKDTVYTITMDIEGKTKNGNPFNRTLIHSLYEAGANGDRP